MTPTNTQSSKGGAKSAKTVSGSGKGTGQGRGGGRKAGGKVVIINGKQRYVNPDDPNFEKLAGAKIEDGTKPEAQFSQIELIQKAALDAKEELEIVSGLNSDLERKVEALERKSLEYAKLQYNHIKALERTLGNIVTMFNTTLPDGKTYKVDVPEAPNAPKWLLKVEEKINEADAEALEFNTDE